jgi:hypothetical protein
MDSHPGAADSAEVALRAAGHDVVRCRDPHVPSEPCAAFEQACPLDVGDVDAAVDVRATPLPRATSGEHGVVCASRARVPVVIAGKVTFQPFRSLTGFEHHGDGDIAAAVEAAVEHAEAMERAAIAGAASAAAGRTVVAERRGDELVLTVQDAPPGTEGAASVRAHAGARVADPTIRSITVRTKPSQ